MQIQRKSFYLIVIFFIKILMVSGIVCAEPSESALITAAFDGSLKKVNLLLAQGANPNAVDKFGRNALMWAVSLGHLEIAKALIRSGANIHLKDHDGFSALMSTTFPNLELVKNPQDKSYLIARQKEYKNKVKIARLLLKQGAKVNEQSQFGNTALMNAIWYNYRELAELFLEYQADVNLNNRNGMTPLMLAVLQKNMVMVKSLLSKGAKVKLKNQKGETALSIAQKEGHKEIIELLLIVQKE